LTALDKFINCKQTKDMSNQRYLDKYNDVVKALKICNIILNVMEQIVKQENGDILDKSD